MEIKFIKYLKNRFKEGYIIRLTDEVAFFYKIRTKDIILKDITFSFSKGGNLHKDFITKCKFLNINIDEFDYLSNNNYKDMLKNLEIDFKLTLPLTEEQNKRLELLIK